MPRGSWPDRVSAVSDHRRVMARAAGKAEVEVNLDLGVGLDVHRGGALRRRAEQVSKGR